MVRHQLFDVELTLNRTLVLGLITGFVVAVYVLVVYITQAVAPGPTGACSWSRSPPPFFSRRPRATAGAGRRSTGGCSGTGTTPTPWWPTSSRDVAAASQPVEALQRLVEGLCDALRLPYAAFTGDAVQVVDRHPDARQPGGPARDRARANRRRRPRRPAQHRRAAGRPPQRGGGRGGSRPRRHPRLRSRAGHRHRGQPGPDRRRARGGTPSAARRPARRGRPRPWPAPPSSSSPARRLEPTTTTSPSAPRACATACAAARRRRYGGGARAAPAGARPAGAGRRAGSWSAGHDQQECVDAYGDLGEVDAAVEVAAYAIAAEAFGQRAATQRGQPVPRRRRRTTRLGSS